MRWRRIGAAILAVACFSVPHMVLAKGSDIRLERAERTYLRGISVTGGTRAGDIAAWADAAALGRISVLRRDGTPADAAEPAATGQVLKTASSEIAVVVSGDVLGTGQFSLSQLTAMAKGVTRGFGDGACERAADLNEDGRAGISDVVAAVQFLQSAATSGAASGPETGQAEAPEAAQTVQLVNEIRSAHGIAPLRVNEGLNRAAEVRVKEIIASGCFSHTRPDGRRFSTVFDGPPMAGENLARIKGYPDEDTVRATVEALRKSDDHLKNMCREFYTQIGAAYAKAPDGRWYSCHLFSADGEVAFVDTPVAE